VQLSNLTHFLLNLAIRELLRANVSHTLSDPAEVDDEIRFLLSSLSA
jgi:hypothetical protein